MIVACTKCQMRYQVPDEKIRSTGTKVQCRKCGTAFVVMPQSSTQLPETSTAASVISAVSPQPKPQTAPPPSPGPSAPKAAPAARKIGDDVFVKRGLIEVSASDADELAILSAESVTNDQREFPKPISKKIKHELSKAFEAFDKKKDVVVSKIKHLTGLHEIPKQVSTSRSASAFIIMALIFAGLFYYYKTPIETAPMSVEVVARSKEWLKSDLKFLTDYLDNNIPTNSNNSESQRLRFFRAEAIITRGLWNSDAKEISRGLLESNLAAASTHSDPYRWHPLIAMALWADDFTTLRKIAELTDESSHLPEIQLVHAIAKIRKNPTTPDSYRTLSKIVTEEPDFNAAQWWALSLSLDQPQGGKDLLSPDKKEALISKFKKLRTELKTGLPPLFENLEKKIPSTTAGALGTSAATIPSPTKLLK